MAIITRAKLEGVSKKILETKSFSHSLMVNESKEYKQKGKIPDVFLSHSHTDVKDVEWARDLLKENSSTAYIDWLDSSMPLFTDANTAKKLKDYIKGCKKFIFLATGSAIESKWCNWELGYGDAYKYIANIALFPIADNAGAWKGAEYLKIYPRIEESDHWSDLYHVIYPDGQKFELSM